MRPTVLLTGASGQVGSALLPLLREIGEVIAPGRRELDLFDANGLQRAVRGIQPQWIVNAAAYTAVDAAETDEASAYAINARAPAVLAEEAKRVGAGMVHFSTDYVFDGSKAAPYEEGDPATPVNVYGRTKLAGEQAVRDCGIPHLIFRTAWIYSSHGRNFLLTILKLATEKEELRVVCDQFGAPTWSQEIAAATSKILTQILGSADAASMLPQVSGTYHMTAGGETSWCDFARAILEEAAHLSREVPWFAVATGGRPLVTTKVTPIPTAAYTTPASRPAHSVLSNSRLIRTFGFALPGWRTQLQRAFSGETDVRGAADAGGCSVVTSDASPPSCTSHASSGQGSPHRGSALEPPR